MAIELSVDAESRLRELAAAQGRDVASLVEEAVNRYIELISITDLSSAEIAELQMALIRELPPIPAWDTGDE